MKRIRLKNKGKGESEKTKDKRQKTQRNEVVPKAPFFNPPLNPPGGTYWKPMT
jgi:hypothetical protein